MSLSAGKNVTQSIINMKKKLRKCIERKELTSIEHFSFSRYAGQVISDWEAV